ncbi:hypothetical protein B0T17DRAFT_650920 [Bombardia bombarda]|uniref:Uncharacterized protein n=1 Tax=Bombardia bombarda TaxID=252184 RepID=A0AA40CF70_9PEZI|nr:hypothetical protein B0T17DRAFT_650920 [Bombardia bombarda]
MRTRPGMVRVPPLGEPGLIVDTQPPPFSVRILSAEADGADASQPDRWLDLLLLPASYRTDADDLVAPSRHVTSCIERELNLSRLDSIFVTEQIDMHLVWTASRIFLKPIPRFPARAALLGRSSLLRAGLCLCRGGYGCPQRLRSSKAPQAGSRIPVLSYAGLISHESDFHIATEKRLLPPEATWSGWRTLIDARFVYGELRLSRLNKIYILSRRPFFRGYMFIDNWVAAVAYKKRRLHALEASSGS